MADTNFMMVKQETRWGYIPPQQQQAQQTQHQSMPQQQIFSQQAPVAQSQFAPQQQTISQQNANNITNIFNNYSAPASMNRSAMQQPTGTQQYIPQQTGMNTRAIYNNYVAQPSIMTPQVAAYGSAMPNYGAQIPNYGAQAQPSVIVLPMPMSKPAATTTNTETTSKEKTNNTETKATSSEDKTMQMMMTLMTALLGKSKKTDKDDDKTDDVEAKDLTSLKAAEILKAKSKELDEADGKTADNSIEWAKVEEYAAKHKDDKELKAAIEYFKNEKTEFNLLESNRTSSEDGDKKCNISDLDNYIKNQKETPGTSKTRYRQEYTTIDELKREVDLDGDGKCSAEEMKAAGNALIGYENVNIGSDSYKVFSKHDSKIHNLAQRVDGTRGRDLIFATNLEDKMFFSDNVVSADGGNDIVFAANIGHGDVEGDSGDDTIIDGGGIKGYHNNQFEHHL